MTAETDNKVRWPDDVLNRQETANYLTKYLTKRYADKKNEKGFVLAINADWGYGKTYMLERWSKDLINLEYPVVLFDAWQNDFTPEPLIAFIAELEKALSPLFKKVPAAKRLMKKVVGNANALWKPSTDALLHLIAKKMFHMGYEELRELFDTSPDAEAIKEAMGKSGGKELSPEELFKALSKVYDSTLKAHSNKKTAITAFRSNLELLIKELEQHSKYRLPIFIFIDELDRCRPDYAIELLEGIKHLFGVPGIYFVVATNMRQLGESTKAIYGSGFDGQQYLKRFFDLEFSLPLPDNETFARALFKDISLPPLSKIETGLIGSVFHGEIKTEEILSYIFAHHASYFGIGLRDQQQVIKIVEAAFLSIDGQVHVHYLFFLAMLYHRSTSVFNQTIKDRAVEATPEYKEMLSHTRRGVGYFQIPQDGDLHNRNPAPKLVSPAAIAKIYLDNAWKDAKELKQNINTYDFPENLVLPLAKEVPNPHIRLRHYEPSIRNYPDIIRHAGGFAKKEEKKEY
jgi:hypothetical protein